MNCHNHEMLECFMGWTALDTSASVRNSSSEQRIRVVA